MRIAIPTSGGLLCPHFGHCDEFTIVEIDDTRKIVGTEAIPAPEHQPGLLPVWLREQGTDVVIAGGMGMRAQQIFSQNGVDVVVGAPVASPAEIAAGYLDGTLVTEGNEKQTVHCKNDDPEKCADDLLRMLQGRLPKSARAALIGHQPRMAETLASFFHLRVTDLDPDNIGQTKSGVVIEGEEKTDEVLDWCDIALVTGSTLVNGTIDKYMGLKSPTIFYGMTISGAAALLGLTRFCPRSHES